MYVCTTLIVGRAIANAWVCGCLYTHLNYAEQAKHLLSAQPHYFHLANGKRLKAV